MPVYKILRLGRHVWTARRGCQRVVSTPARFSKLVYVQSYGTTTADKNDKFRGFWRLTKRWVFSVPIGIGATLIAVLQWRHLRKHPYPADGDVVKGPLSDLMVDCYCCLPLRITSRVFGWFAGVELPKGLRSTIFRLYAKTFNANLNEIADELESFPSLIDFFVRSLKQDARPICQNTDIVSPSDGRVLHFGPVTSCRVEQVKGITYNLRHFLGDVQLKIKTEYSNEDNDNYIKTLLKNPNNQLYQMTVYLAPGDYHRFHSPTDWKINFRRHFQGKLLSVNPKIASWLPELFAINERVVYLGEWAGGFMAYTAVGATNVGSIKVYCDNNLATNKRKWPKGKYSDDAEFDWISVGKGELFGEFRMGSTIVLLFEAPADFKFSINNGQSIKVGEGLTEHFVSRNCKKIIDIHKSAKDALKFINPSMRD